MDFEYLDKWIGTANFQKILEALENDKTEKKLFVDIVLDVGSIQQYYGSLQMKIIMKTKMIRENLRGKMATIISQY